VRTDGVATAVRTGPFVARPLRRGALVTVGGKRYRGEIVIARSDSGLTVVNRLPMEDYLRGVVPLEMGKRTPDEAAAIEAQAVAARSYTYTRLSREGERLYDLVATVMDQVYGGADAETPLTDSAVAATAGLVLRYAGRVVNAPYHSTCGGSTAAASEVWPSQADEPFLRPVSDRVPGTDRFYCDPSPSFRWTRTFDRAGLGAALARYLRSYAAVPSGGVGAVRGVEVDGRTPSGRVRALVIATDRGRYTVRGNDVRFVLRPPGGEILNSTYFSVDAERDGSGEVSRLVLRGVGYGHGVGMCQWGAIGRARAGQDFRTILHNYYPGTTVETVD
jgi:stage II sporulation protein D